MKLLWAPGALYRLVTASLVLAVAQTAAGQDAPITREHSVGFGVHVSLPDGWVADSAAALTALRARTVEGMRSSSLTSLREFASRNRNAPLFRASDPQRRANSSNVNVTFDSTITAQDFANATVSDIDNMVRSVCEGHRRQASEAGGEGACLRHEVRILDGRTVIVLFQSLRLDRAGLDNTRVVVLLPTSGALLTLSLSVHRQGVYADFGDAFLKGIRVTAAASR